MSETKSNFVRQSAWMSIATVVGGAFMTGVHTVASQMETSQYEVFGAMLRLFLLLGIPGAGLQTVFAQQTAAALTPEQLHQLASLTRRVLAGLTGVWFVMLFAAIFYQDAILSTLKLGDPVILWTTLALAYLWLALPVFRGLLQGTQNFANLGIVAIVDGVVRFTSVAVVVLLFRGKAAGAMGGALLGLLISTLWAAWSTRQVWMGPGHPVAWGPWVRRVIPFTVVAGAMLSLAYYDLIFLKALIPAERADEFLMGARFQPASMIGFALTQVTVPLAMVMFPKVARSKAGGGTTDALALAVMGTAILGAMGAVGVTLLPKLPLQILFFRTPDNWAAAPIVPWCTWAMLAFAMANVLVTGLVAEGRFRVVPVAAVVALAYLITLHQLGPTILSREPFDAFRLTAQITGGFNLLLLLLASVMTWGPGFRRA